MSNRMAKRTTSRTAKPKRRATAQSMAAKQRDISVSEFFAKNRHLLRLRQSAEGAADDRQGSGRQLARRLRGSRHPARDLGSHRSHRPRSVQSRHSGQRSRHRQKANPAHLRQAAVRLEVSPAAAKPRAAGHRHQRGRHVRRADDRQAGEDHLEGRRQEAGPLLRNSDRHEEERAADSQRPRRRRRYSGRQEEAGRSDRETRESNGWISRTARG